MPRFIARIDDNDKGRSFVEIEADSPEDAYSKLRSRGMSVDGLFIQGHAPFDANALPLGVSLTASQGPATSISKPMARGIEFLGLLALLIGFITALVNSVPSHQVVRIGPDGSRHITIVDSDAEAAFPFMGLLTLAAWTLVPIAARPFSATNRLAHHRFGVPALLVLAAICWFTGMSGTLTGKAYEPWLAMLCLGLAAWCFYLALYSDSANVATTPSQPPAA